MAEVTSNMIPLGTKAPYFKLIDTRTEQEVTLNTVKPSIATVIMFISNHCPYVKLISEQLVQIAKIYQAKGVIFLAICSNDVVNYPDDAPDKMKLEAELQGYTFPYMFDETQEVAKAYQAACTPDFYIFDKDLRCAYRGRFDSATPGNAHPVTGADLKNALDDILSGKPVSAEQIPSVGCNIKWKEA